MGLNLMSGFAFAITADPANTLNINITNATSSLCKLDNYALRLGDFYLAKYIPEYIPAYSSAAPILLNSCDSAELELSYTCGDNKKIHFTSKQITYLFSSDLSASILFSLNMTAKSNITQGYYHHAIDWRFEE